MMLNQPIVTVEPKAAERTFASFHATATIPSAWQTPLPAQTEATLERENTETTTTLLSNHQSDFNSLPKTFRKTKIIATLGHKLVRLKPVNGFAAEATGATILLIAGKMGMPISTTHAITTAIMGVGCARRFNALNFILVERILWTWIFTIPATGLLAWSLVRVCQMLHWAH